MLELLELEPRLCPVVHPFTPAALVAASDNAAGTPANATVAANLGGLPAPLVASDGAVPFDAVPGRDVVFQLWTDLGRL